MDTGLFVLHIVLVLRKKESKEKAGKAERLELFAAAFQLSNEKVVCFLEPCTNFRLVLHLPVLLQSFRIMIKYDHS